MKKLFYLMAGFAIVLLVLYTYIGGFTAPDISVITSKPLYVAGIPFKGSMDDEALQEAFRQSADLLKAGTLNGTLGNIYYNNPESSSDSIEAFIGVLVPDSAVALPAGYELRTVPGGRQVVHVEVVANLAIAPQKLYSAAFDYAKEENLKLEEFYVEWFPGEDRGVLEVPVQQ
ncbi:GyrI-like domain-containing protein [Pontibacter sp. CAU 1760]